MALQVLSRLRRAFQVEISVRVFFEEPTVAGLAKAIAKAQESASETQAVAIAPLHREVYRMRPSSPGGAEGTRRPS